MGTVSRAKYQSDLGSDQTSLHNPWAGGYYPVDLSYEESNELMAHDPKSLKEKVQEILRRHVTAVNKLSEAGMYFFDYGNAFIGKACRAGSDITEQDGSFTYPSYVQDIMGPMCFDYGFGPFRWVCAFLVNRKISKPMRMIGQVIEENAFKRACRNQRSVTRQPIAGQRSTAKQTCCRLASPNICRRGTDYDFATAFNRAIKEGKIGPVVPWAATIS